MARPAVLVQEDHRASTRAAAGPVGSAEYIGQADAEQAEAADLQQAATSDGVQWVKHGYALGLFTFSARPPREENHAHPAAGGR